MGKFVNFFKKIGGGIKKAFNWVKEKIAPVVRKVLPFAKPILGMIPGVGPSIVKGVEMGERIAGGADKFINGSAQDRKDMLHQGIGLLQNRLGGGGGTDPPKIM
jgi:hypothetical protein